MSIRFANRPQIFVHQHRFDFLWFFSSIYSLWRVVWPRSSGENVAWPAGHIHLQHEWGTECIISFHNFDSLLSTGQIVIFRLMMVTRRKMRTPHKQWVTVLRQRGRTAQLFQVAVVPNAAGWEWRQVGDTSRGEKQGSKSIFPFCFILQFFAKKKKK